MGRPGPASGVGVQLPYVSGHVVLPLVNQTPVAPNGGTGTGPSGGFALHVGVDSVDGESYGGWPGTLQSSVSDAQAMSQLSASLGYVASTLTNEEATSYAVTSAIQNFRGTCLPGDTLLITFSGHGGQVPGADDRTGGAVDTWVLYDRMLIDDEIRALLASFPPEVRIVVISDCCHSGSDDDIGPEPPDEGGGGVLPELRPRVIQREASDANVAKFGALYTLTAPVLRVHNAVAAETILLAACKDDEEAWEDATHGVFTSGLLSAWANGDYDGTYDRLLELAAQEVQDLDQGHRQTPQLHPCGGSGVNRLGKERAFVLTPAPSPAYPATSLSAGGSSTVSISFSGPQPPASVTVTFER